MRRSDAPARPSSSRTCSAASSRRVRVSRVTAAYSNTVCMDSTSELAFTNSVSNTV
ncbi:Uncharacterised protein [Mycobacteroides abscessus subsp. abscessus]|nr:Uncharacterised protein [Mycobacteroides abscessus subsp. abscessus]